jgi:hypothetical protein
LVRPRALRTVTSIRVALVGRISHSAAADAWLSAAPGPAGEHRGHPAPVDREDGVPHGVDAAMHAMQASRLRTCRHCVAREPDRRELPGGDHAVLPLSQPSDDLSHVPGENRRSPSMHPGWQGNSRV